MNLTLLLKSVFTLGLSMAFIQGVSAETITCAPVELKNGFFLEAEAVETDSALGYQLQVRQLELVPYSDVQPNYYVSAFNAEVSKKVADIFEQTVTRYAAATKNIEIEEIKFISVLLDGPTSLQSWVMLQNGSKFYALCKR